MNIYFVFEGKTEPIVYKEWLKYLLPNITEVNYIEQVKENNYFYESDMGIPDCYQIIANAVQEINENPIFKYLVLCIDADELSINEKIQEANYFIDLKLNDEKNNFKFKTLPNSCELKIIIQKVCIETWFLGNQKFFVRNPQNQELKKYIEYFDVSKQNPELMENLGYTTKAQFHVSYLKEIFKERLNGKSYHKSKPIEVQKQTYLKEIIKRINKEKKDLESFQEFISFCNQIKQ